MSPLVMPRTVLIPKIICQKFKCWKISKTQTLKGGNKCHKLCNDRFWLLNGWFSSVLLLKLLILRSNFYFNYTECLYIGLNTNNHLSSWFHNIPRVSGQLPYLVAYMYARLRNVKTSKSSDLLSNFWKLNLISWKHRIEHAMSTS